MINRYKKILGILMICLSLISCGQPKMPTDVEIKTAIHEHLKKEYNEEFYMDMLGTRTFRGKPYYRVRIRPKWVMGTKNENDPYYEAGASIYVNAKGELYNPGDSYSYVSLKLGIEKLLAPKIKELFGDMTILHVDAEFFKKENDFGGYKEGNINEVLKMLKEEPERHKINLRMTLCIFDRIDDKKEMEKRKKDIYELTQFIDENNLGNNTYLGIFFVEDVTLSNSFKKIQKQVRSIEKVEKKIGNEELLFIPYKKKIEYYSILVREIKRMTLLEKNKNFNKFTHKQIMGEDIFDGYFFNSFYESDTLDKKNESNNLNSNNIHIEISETSIGNKLKY